MCPTITDWEEYYLIDERENTYARVYKSSSAKLAVIAFRGTEMDSPENWGIDLDAGMRVVDLLGVADATSAAGGAAPRAPASASVHAGFHAALERVLPHIRKWVEGYIEGTMGMWNVPADWQLVFTGHSLGGAFATLAATMAEVQGWTKKPDAVITFGAPRVGDGNLSEWWAAHGLCEKLLRVNVYNDVVHWMPSIHAPAMLAAGLLGCIQDVGHCFQQPNLMGVVEGITEDRKSLRTEDPWRHICPSSEFFVPGALKGINSEMQDFSPLGGILSHALGNGLFGYGYGVLYGGILLHDSRCGLKPDVFPRFDCAASEDLTGVVCMGLELDPHAPNVETCRAHCCKDPYCEVWQMMKDSACWRGRSSVCDRHHKDASAVILSQRVH